ncbi:hypothetical protein GGI06_000147 [Coemansia sp. S85]|nr:hypothetical protein GGI06_000147 [Coemansia sp. S85]
MNDRAPENDPCKPVYHKHVECYKCIIKMLNKHCDSMLNSNSLAILPNNDTLFQFALYNWLLGQGQSSLLFQMHAPFVEKLLSLELHTMEKCNMLWQFYIHKNQFGKASLVQQELVSSSWEGFNIDLAWHIEYEGHPNT